MKFTVGQTVQIGDAIFSRYHEQLGTVLEIIPHPRGRDTLDKYRIQFSDGSESIFWSIQLKPAAFGQSNSS